MAKSYREFGSRYTSKDYEPLMEGADILEEPESLLNHAITSPGQELTEPVIQNYVDKVRGRIVERQRVIRTGVQQAVTFTIMFPNTLETYALNKARKMEGTNHRTRLYMVNLCPGRETEAHAYIYDDVTIPPPNRVNDVITIEDTAMADWQAEARAGNEFLILALQVNKQQTVANGDALYAVAIMSEDCSTAAGNISYADAIATGGEGTTAPLLLFKTTDRFATATTVNTPAPAGSIGNSIFTEGDVVLVGFADTPRTSAATATVGGVLFSQDGLATDPVLDTNVTLPVYGVTKLSGRYIIGGGTISGGAYLAYSTNGTTFTTIASAALPVDEVIVCLKTDMFNEVVYAGTSGGKLLRITPVGDSYIITEVAVTGSPTAIYSIAVHGRDHISIAGAAGYYRETIDNTATWRTIPVGTSATIQSHTGNIFRSLIGAATSIRERSILTEGQYKPLRNAVGTSVTGNITSVAMIDTMSVTNDQLRYFYAVSDAGEALFIVDASPFA